MSWLRLLADTARGSLALWRLAIWIPLIAVIPEFLQHVAEIRLGMFDSSDAFRSLQNAPERWSWGYLKMAGLTAAWLLTVWYWNRRDGGQTRWRQVGIALAVNAAASAAVLLLTAAVPKAAADAVSLTLSVVTLPLLVYLIGALLGDAAMTLKRSYGAGWLVGLRIGLLSLTGLVVMQALHQFNHTLAMGQPAALVWALMVWDSLLVGLMAVWLGTALHRGYRGSPL